MQLLDGKAISSQIKSEIKAEVEQWVAGGGKKPHLAAILVGQDGASETYVASKIRSCEEIGFTSTLLRFEADITEAQLLEAVESLNNDPDVDGFIVQLPLPKHISENTVMEAVNPAKDVDGFHPINVGRMCKGLPAYISATPFGILEMLIRAGIETSGKHCVVIGRSQIVGLPMSILMQRNTYPGNCTVTITHSKTQNLKEICQSADILIVALGRPEFVKADYIKEGAVVVDVGITRVADATKKSGFSIKGDVDFNDVAPKSSYITPVPGGVGLMTICGLLTNTFKAAKKEIYK
ncbi:MULTISPECIES: bifunctional 5,10-methylenetetrahydrofolate dehydrogenase/5,10-methenyltetrahydrofolate cyclohydrolase [Dyadobacter]|jgi:methylenetetrahydrofolate dehydrogenase (NADP+)/methenyltetrahydrofolate cyclohydrolase|uniref:Bifunctional protein FolD n=2 Tax=Dyadobacter TaxID=120831 RepID=A0A2P8FRN0_9BACT|nr:MULTISPECIES: tetrahydrofolate dehydrogenase/cyclohydrolase catalytic domain-containing protein [Dyadobacter]MDR6805638.1 methylenetetrahydrofolate dehydrogenase (NADP+)/methenyltetrahydrofolate cyclohydrolase [Dyadobacter fermentans]MDR7042602.1 methylenetetrahydrofolate dehydrogenase (NADP+)/methenyltetrahydrofolate cyclohydrolase [Dyadobacter sp. BE242]MDR7196914.1 methylenetetrahydrofolate dehydrogenase (NADP+)/methenyltetrahydrofolate cyclohydrolase [Dyadobacter sp. BE34]MDR7215651.1 me